MAPSIGGNVRLITAGIVLVLGFSLVGCVTEEAARELASEDQDYEPSRPDFLDNGIQQGEDLAKEFDALPDDTPVKKKAKHAAR